MATCETDDECDLSTYNASTIEMIYHAIHPKSATNTI